MEDENSLSSGVQEPEPQQAAEAEVDVEPELEPEPDYNGCPHSVGRSGEIGSSEKAGFNLPAETTLVLSPS